MDQTKPTISFRRFASAGSLHGGCPLDQDRLAALKKLMPKPPEFGRSDTQFPECDLVGVPGTGIFDLVVFMGNILPKEK